MPSTLSFLASALLVGSPVAAEAPGNRVTHTVDICKETLWSFGPVDRGFVVTAVLFEKGDVRKTAERCVPGKASARLLGMRGESIGEARFAADGNELSISISIPSAESIVLSIEDSGESYFGLTEHPPPDRLLNNRGAILRYGPISHPSRANARAPFYFTNRGAAVFVSRGDPVSYELGVDDVTRIRVRGESIELRALVGADYRSIMEWQNRVVGPTVVPPSWALGPLWWRDDPHEASPPGEAAIVADAQALVRLALPASGIWIDRPYGSGPLGWGNFDFAASFPSPESMMKKLSAMGLPTLLWIANRASSRMYAEGSSKGFLFPGSEKDWPAMDVRRADAAGWLRSELEALARSGAKGFKIDRGDEGEMPRAAANEIAALLPAIASEALRAVHGRDHFVFARNIAGTGRRYAGVWSGDPEASFRGLRLALLHGLRASLAGFPLWGSDTGGYIGSPDEELHTRWLAFSAFTPIMEIPIDHGAPIWERFGAGHLTALRRYTSLHWRLVPYLHSELAESARSGLPVMRPMLLEWPDGSWEDVWDQYMLGRYLLVAPLLSKGATEREVRFPPGRWIPLSERSRSVRGPARLRIEAPLGEIPVFVKEGAIVPWRDEKGIYDLSFYPSESGRNSFPLLLGSGVRKDVSMNVRLREVDIEIPDLGTSVRAFVHCRGPDGMRISGGKVLERSEERLELETRGAARISLRCAGPA